jgi:hypothetical protein
VAENLTEMLAILPTDNLSRSSAGVPKTGTVEAVSHESLLCPLKRPGISSRRLGQCAMKGRVKDRKLWHFATQDFSASRDSGQTGGIVERSEFSQSINSRFNVRIYQCCAAEFQAAVNDSMADQVYLVRHFESRRFAFPGGADQRFQFFCQ